MSEQDKPIRKTWIMLRRAYNGIALSSLPIGTLVKDINSTFLGTPVIWKVADINHEGYPANSITLITERCIALRPFDAAEPKNSLSQQKYYGNPIYSVSNIRQWLNSDAEAGQWYTAQHSADQSPSTGYVDNGANAYNNDAGFLNDFSEGFKNSLLNTTLITGEYGVAKTSVDKVFLASRTEVVGTAYNNIKDGKILSLFSTAANRKSYVTAEAIKDNESSNTPSSTSKAWYWWCRTPFGTLVNNQSAGEIMNDGAYSGRSAYCNFLGVRPLCNLPSTVRVSETPDENGIYTIVQF